MADRNDQRLVMIAGGGSSHGHAVAERLGTRGTDVAVPDTNGRTPAPDEGTAA